MRNLKSVLNAIKNSDLCNNIMTTVLMLDDEDHDF